MNYSESLFSEANTKSLKTVIAGRARIINNGRNWFNARFNYNDNAIQSAASAVLMWACFQGHLVVVRELLKHETELDVNFVDGYDRTAMSCAIFGKKCPYRLLFEEDEKYGAYFDVVLALLKHKSLDLNVVCEGGCATSLAIRCGQGDIVYELLTCHNVDNLSADTMDRMALTCTCCFERFDFFCWLLNHGQDDVNRLGEDGMTPLTHAFYYFDERYFREILKYDGLDVNARNINGDTTLTFLCKQEFEILPLRELLEDPRVDVNAMDSNGHTPLLCACFIDEPRAVHELLKHEQVDVNARDDQGRNALIWACQEYHDDIVVELLKHDNLNVNVQDAIGNTALFWASLKGSLDVVGMLLKHKKVDMRLKNKAGSTALDIARICERFEIVQHLEMHATMCERRRDEEERVERCEHAQGTTAGAE